MNLIITQSIEKKECKKLSKKDLSIIVDTYKKNISSDIRGIGLPPYMKLIKVYATSKQGARRIVFLVDLVSSDAFLLFYRTKNDKLGSNISIKNPFFKKRLHEYLKLIQNDIREGNYHVI